MSAYREHIGTLLAGEPLPADGARALWRELLGGDLDPPAAAAVLTALATRPVTAPEMTAFAKVMREHAIGVAVTGDCLDTCGTGGSGLPTLNTSTLVAFVAAAAGVRVAKHGNRASSGKCGSMDVLEHLGVNVQLDAARASELLASGPFVFLNARAHHPALGPLGPVRRALGFRTVFNFLGPICNPANVNRQLLGVSDLRFAELMFETLVALGSKRLMVVVGDGGLDEIALSGPTTVLELEDGERRRYELTPEDVGLEREPFAAIAGDDVATNAAKFRAILDGEERGAPHRHVALNAGAALYVAGVTESVAEGLARATEILASGEATKVFDTYREASSS